MTRTVFLGKPKPRERNAYLTVLEAQEAAVEATAGGVTCGEVDEAARNILRRKRDSAMRSRTPPVMESAWRFTSRLA